ncbi:MAG: tRNA (N6-isopentenyl adenosine(37)-C2)-methylthiotransferase MiaB [Spirochaetaceae bacterium]|nr:tRNA (N6-isopentenyl adenosine(37)-C2)-methylthiotransferase MiaB [Spirochaetaceae bacterium]
MNFLLESYGCQMNSAESAAMERHLARSGWQRCSECTEADLVIINTCSVRATAEQRILGRLALYAAKKREHPFAVLVTGCAAATIPETLLSGGADYVMPPEEKHRLTQILAEVESASQEHSAVSTPDGLFAENHYREGEPSALVPVMHGCDNFCSYCIVPYARGREVSRPWQAIGAEIDFLAEKGVREITLLGQNVCAYRAAADGQSPEAADFAGLVRAAARRVEGGPIRWVRFLSAHPKDFSDGLIAALAENRCFCRHIHLPVQHGADIMLAAMNRRYTRAAYIELTRKLRAALPDLTLSTDILTGFPGETAADFEQILTLMDEVRFTDAFMYHYNPRAGTAAYSLPNRVPEEVKRRRLARVIALQRQHTKAALEAALGQERLVLAEKVSRKNEAELLCRSEHDEMCVVEATPSHVGTFLTVRLTALNGNTYKAAVLD